MRRAARSVMVAALVVGVGALAGCSPAKPATDAHHVVLDLHHGAMSPVVRSAVEGGGFTLLMNDHALTREALQDAGALWLTASAHVDFTADEVAAVKAFVAGGGTLICSGQAWSWANDKKDVAAYPLNEVGKALGFTISAQNIGSPTGREPSPYLVGVETIVRSGWWPSLVESDAPGSQVLIRDQNLKSMALTFPLGKGRVFVFGHEGMLTDNPLLVTNVLNLQGLGRH